MIRFQITIKPHDPEQPLFWLSMPKPETELLQLEEVIEAHVEARRLSLEKVDGTHAENVEALHTEVSAFRALMEFPCRTAEAKARKVQYLIAFYREAGRFEMWMEFKPFTALLESLVA